VAHWLFVLETVDSESNHIATQRHIGALVELAMLATRELASDLCKLEEKHQAGAPEEASPC